VQRRFPQRLRGSALALDYNHGVAETSPLGENVGSWRECDLRPALINVRSWESNGLNADVAFGPFMTRSGHRIELGRKQVLSHDLAGMAGETDHKNVNPDGIDVVRSATGVS